VLLPGEKDRANMTENTSCSARSPNSCGSNEEFLLSVVMPIYNERATVIRIIERVRAAPYHKQIILVDDGSTDGTRELIQQYRGRDGFDVVLQPRNIGKGAAIRAALPLLRGQAVIIQDADLEYDPGDYPLLIEIIRKGYADVVYGSRYLSYQSTLPWTRFRLGVHLLNWLVRLLYFYPLTDEATCYKAFRTEVIRKLNLRCRRFEFCPEVTAKCLKRGYKIIEVPISFRFRTVEEGKKIGWRDAFEAAWTLLKCRFVG
jgi:dolichol-phosphate mannosyltransferase